MRPWRSDADNLEASLLDAVSNIVHGNSEDELLLKTGINLTTPDQVQVIAAKTVHTLGGSALMVCLADIADDEAEGLGHGIADWRVQLDPPGQTTFYFNDTGSAKANVAAILRQRLGDRIAKLASI